MTRSSKFKGNLFALTAFVVLVVTSPASASNCSVSGTDLVFGAVNVLPGTAVPTTATVTITCGGDLLGATVQICATLGAGSSSDGTSRKMVGPSASTLRFDAYSNAAYTQVWPTSGGIHTTLNTPLFFGNASTTLTIYGRLFAGQSTALVGSYSSIFSNTLTVQYNSSVLASTSCPNGGASVSDTIVATASVTSTCNVNATNMNFGSVGLLSANLDTTSQISVQCTNGAPYKMQLSYGLGAGAGAGVGRYMTSGANKILYNLYRDASRSSVWGNSLGVDTVDTTGTGASQLRSVYGRVPPQTTPPTGTYFDTITTTISY